MAQSFKTGTGAAEFQALTGSLTYLLVDAANNTANIANLVVGGQGSEVLNAIGQTNTVVVLDVEDAETMHIAVEGTAVAATLQTAVRALGGSLSAATVVTGSFRVV